MPLAFAAGSWPSLCQTTTNSPLGSRDTEGRDWSPVVKLLMTNSTPCRAPVDAKRWPKTSSPAAPWGPAQTTTKSPAPSAATFTGD